MENVSSVRPSGKFLEKKGKSKKVGPLSRLERSERKFAFHLHVSRSLHQFQVQGKKKKKKKKNNLTASSQNKMAPSSLHSGTSAQVFFGCPLRMTRGTLEKLCRDIAATGSIRQGNRFGRPPIPGGWFLSSARFWHLFGWWLIQKWWNPFRIDLT